MLSLSEIKSIINEDNTNLGGLSTSNNINKWSFYKPVPVNTYSRVTDFEIKSVDDGFDLPNLVGDFEDAIKLIEQDRVYFGYSTNPPYRIGDFINYDPIAEPWFNLSSVITGSTLEITPNQPQQFDLIQSFETGLQFDNYGYILYNPNITYYWNGGNIIPTSNIVSNTYTIYPCLSNAEFQNHLYNPSTSSHLRFLLLESNKNTVQVVNTQPSVFDNIVVTVIWNSGGYNLGECAFRGSVQITSDRSLYLRILNNNDETAESQMYYQQVNNVTLYDSDMQFTNWTSSREFARIDIRLECQGQTEDIFVFVDDPSELPISKTFVYNGSYYEEES